MQMPEIEKVTAPYTSVAPGEKDLATPAHSLHALPRMDTHRLKLARYKRPLQQWLAVAVLTLANAYVFDMASQPPPLTSRSWPFTYPCTLLFLYIPFSMIMLFYVCRVVTTGRVGGMDGFVLYYGMLSAIATVILTFATVYKFTGLRDGDGSVADTATAIYFSIITITTVGFGDVVPEPNSRPYVCAEALLGWVIAGVIVAVVIGFIQQPVSDAKSRAAE